MRTLNVNLKNYTYEIIIEDGLLFNLASYIKKVYFEKKIFIITDDIVGTIYLDLVKKSLKEFDLEVVVIKNGEASKNIETYVKVCQELLDKDIRRNHLLLALGGGVVGDLTGFVAATLFRGIPYIGIPTSLLSQMDSSIGGKTGIDFAGRKNILGSFKQPLMVLIDPNTLKTLDEREFNNGMGELIKHACIGNKGLFELLLSKPCINEEIIYQSLSVKKRLVELDEFDLNERMLLNFGHTFGHIIELERNIKHGEAVGLGMLMALKMGIDLNITDSSCYIRLKEILKLYNLDFSEPDYKNYLLKTFYDKKNLAGNIRFILLKDIGEAFIYLLSEKQVKEGLYESSNNSE